MSNATIVLHCEIVVDTSSLSLPPLSLSVLSICPCSRCLRCRCPHFRYVLAIVVLTVAFYLLLIVNWDKDSYFSTFYNLGFSFLDPIQYTLTHIQIPSASVTSRCLLSPFILPSFPFMKFKAPASSILSSCYHFLSILFFYFVLVADSGLLQTAACLFHVYKSICIFSKKHHSFLCRL